PPPPTHGGGGGKQAHHWVHLGPGVLPATPDRRGATQPRGRPQGAPGARPGAAPARAAARPQPVARGGAPAGVPGARGGLLRGHDGHLLAPDALAGQVPRDAVARLRRLHRRAAALANEDRQVPPRRASRSHGTWMDVPPLGEDHLVVNLGEMLMLMTDGYYVATQHRVRSDPQRSRVSVPFFFNPSLAAVVKPLPADLLGRLPWERDRSLADSRRADERNAIFQDYGMNAFKSLFRSHPEVSARHHPDLELLPSGDVRLRGRPQSAAPGPVPHDRR
ncbi:unnamed protein product, partial [Prorocentrum cordatum]